MKGLIISLILLMLTPVVTDTVMAARLPDKEPMVSTPYLDAELLVRAPTDSVPREGDRLMVAGDSLVMKDGRLESIPEEPLTIVEADDYPYGLDGKKIFNPDPTKAVWMSVLFPGLGQIYNRRYWKLPIIVAGYMGLAYGTSWNARMFADYQTAYSDIMDDDPDTKSYLNFFAPNFDESSIDQTWLAQTLKSRKDYYRRNRDLCIICCVGLYLLCMLDAYVDASLAHFDISDDLSMDVAPTMLPIPGRRSPTAAINWTFTF